MKITPQNGTLVITLTQAKNSKSTTADTFRVSGRDKIG